jgi:hypothetical protein
MSERPPRQPRAEPREIVELRLLMTERPELAQAAEMQIALVQMQRRIQSRVPLPWIQTEPEWLAAQLAAGRAVVRFEDIPLDWSDFRLIFRQTTDILHRFDALEPKEHQGITALARDGNALEQRVRQWYRATSGAAGTEDDEGSPVDPPLPSLDQVLVIALRPFLARCAEVLAQQIDAQQTLHGRCPVCGWEPDFALITPGAERRLICGRCTAQWLFEPLTCPFCLNRDRSRVTSFATSDGRYRVYACDVCHRYLKAYDGRNAERPVMLSVDSIATLPLDAAAMQRGYQG